MSVLPRHPDSFQCRNDCLLPTDGGWELKITEFCKVLSGHIIGRQQPSSAAFVTVGSFCSLNRTVIIGRSYRKKLIHMTLNCNNPLVSNSA